MLLVGALIYVIGISITLGVCIRLDNDCNSPEVDILATVLWPLTILVLIGYQITKWLVHNE